MAQDPHGDLGKIFPKVCAGVFKEWHHAGGSKLLHCLPGFQ